MKAQQEKSGKTPILSDTLIAGIKETLAQKEQVLLFLNKRDSTPFSYALTAAIISAVPIAPSP